MSLSKVDLKKNDLAATKQAHDFLQNNYIFESSIINQKILAITFFYN